MTRRGQRIVLALLGATCLVALIACARSEAHAAPAPDDDFPSDLLSVDFGHCEITGLDENARRGVNFAVGGRSFTRTAKERAETESPWFDTRTTFSVPFRITDLSGRDGGDVLYVAGIREADGADLIEEWAFPPQRGARVLRAALSPTTTPAVGPVGVPAPPLVLLPGIAGAGDFVIPPAREAAPPERRRMLYTGAELRHIRSLVADPEGRFLLLQAHGNSAIYQLDLLSPAPCTPKLVCSSATTPELKRTTSMSAWDIGAAGGRVYLLVSTEACVTPIDAEWVLLKDPDNDGNFDSIEGFSNAAWLASPYADRAAWGLLHCAPGYNPYGGT